MKLEKIAQYDDGKGLTFQEAIAEAAKRKLRLPSNLEIGARLQGEGWKQEKEMYPCWTGTLIAYGAPGESLGRIIEFGGLVFNVPKKFQGLRDRAIVVDHPDFILKGDIITPGKSAKDISFPESDGWYKIESQFGIPTPIGGKTSDDGKSRYLWRRDEKPYIGLVARYCGRFGGRGRRLVGADYRPVHRLGVFGTASGKMKLPPHKHEWVCATCGAVQGGKKR